MTEYAIIFCIVNDEQAAKTIQIAKNYGISGGTIFYGRGTKRSRVLEFLGLDEIRKEIVIMLAERQLVAEAIRGISRDMELHKANHGVAFSLSVSSLYGVGDAKTTNEVQERNNSMYKLIYTIVEKGRGEEVVDSANRVGATGATIANARGAGPREIKSLFHIEVEPEKEQVLIIARNEITDVIVDAIRSDLQIDEPGKGILFVLDVSEVFGLHRE